MRNIIIIIIIIIYSSPFLFFISSFLHSSPTSLLSLVGDVEHAGEVLAKAVRSSSLDSTAVGGNKGLHGGGVQTSSELLLLGLTAFNHRHGQQLLVHASVVVQNLEDFFRSLLLGGESTVAFLPEELTRANEGSGVLELPANDVSPLVQTKRKITMTTNPASIG